MVNLKIAQLIKWILILYFIILLFPVLFLTWLGYSDSNENPLIILAGSFFFLVFSLGAYSSLRIKKKNDFTKVGLIIPLFVSLVTLFYLGDEVSLFFGGNCIFFYCDNYSVFVLGSVISILILYFYVKIIKRVNNNEK